MGVHDFWTLVEGVQRTQSSDALGARVTLGVDASCVIHFVEPSAAGEAVVVRQLIPSPLDL